MVRTPIIINSCLNIRVSDLSKDEVRDLKVAFAFKNPEYGKLRGMGYGTKGIKSVIKLFGYRGKFMTFPRGSLERIKKILPNKRFKMIDKRVEVPLDKKISLKEEFTFWRHQIPAIEAAIQTEQGLLLGVCGSGKTEMLLGIFAQLNQRTLVIVDTLVLLEQWIL